MTATHERAAFVVHVFPSEDALLRQRVDEILARGAPVDVHAGAAELTDRLRPVYPLVAVRPRADFASLGQPAVYVFRDGHAGRSYDESWITDPATARVVSDATGTYVDANDAAARLFGVGCQEIIGRRAGDFTRPDSRVDAGALWDVLKRTGRLHSLAVIVGMAPARRVEFVAIKDGDGVGRNVTYLREHSTATA